MSTPDTANQATQEEQNQPQRNEVQHIGDTKQPKHHKRQKLDTQTPITIEDLNARKAGTFFSGNVLVVYKVVLDKGTGAREVLRADLTDCKGEMSITLTAGTNLLHTFEDKIIPGSGIAITDFKVSAKGDYDRGDADCILVLTESSTVETINPLTIEYKFIPSTTIKHLLMSASEYPNGSIAAIVVSANKKGNQHILEIKDGHTDMDRAPLYMHTKFAHLYSQMEEQLQKNEPPILLFRNITKKQDHKHVVRTSLSTYICRLNDKRTLQRLHALLHTTVEVVGFLSPTNAYSNPFCAFCPECNYRFDSYGTLDGDKAQCTKYNEEVNYIYSLHIKAMITNDNNQTIQCFLLKNIAEQIWPSFKNMTYEDYINDKSAVIYMLQDFRIRGKFTMNQNTMITRLIPLEN